MPSKHIYSLKLPATEPHQLDQDESYFYIQENGKEVEIRFHEYGEIYRRPGLYEQLFYDRLKCVSPTKICEIVRNVLKQNGVEMNELRVLDFGAGNGMVGECLFKHGIARMVGIDISAEAHEACERDRPGIYDAYYVQDLSTMDEAGLDELRSWHLDCMTCVAALGFGDIPPAAFANAYNLIQPGGWVAFNIKETFLQMADTSGFSRMVNHMLQSDILEVHHLERYRHRVSIDGRPIYYYALAGKKEMDIPLEELSRFTSAEQIPN